MFLIIKFKPERSKKDILTPTDFLLKVNVCIKAIIYNYYTDEDMHFSEMEQYKYHIYIVESTVSETMI